MANKPVFALPVAAGPSASTGALNAEINRVVDEVWKAAVVAGLDTPEAAALAGQVQAAANTATQQASIASAERATTQAVKAEVTGLRDQAESLLADAAAMSGWYDTIALGRAAVADGATFGVLAGGADGFTRPTIFRRESASTQTLVTDPPRGAEVDALAERQRVDGYPGQPVLLLIEDGAGNPGIVKTIEGIQDPQIEALKALQTLEEGYPGQDVLIFQDGAGNPSIVSSRDVAEIGPFKATKDDIDHPVIRDLEGRIANVQVDGNPLTRLRALTAIAQVVHIMVTGQSLGQGVGSTPALSTSALAYAYMFNGGTCWTPYEDADGTPATIADRHASLTGLREGNGAGGTNRETPSRGIAEMMQQLALANGHGFGSAYGQELLLSNAGRGGSKVSELLAEPRWLYPNADIEYGKALCDAAGKTVMLSAMPIIQGESDSGTDGAVWAQSWRHYKAQLIAKAKATYGTAHEFITPIYQGANAGAITEAQLDLSKEEGWCLATPIYWMEKVADGTHLTPTASKHLGAYFGRAIYEWLFLGQRPEPLMPFNLVRLGNALAVQFRVKAGNRLQFDTVQLPLAGNCGFQIYNGASQITITSAAITGRDTVTLTTAAPIPEGVELRYGYNGDGTAATTNMRAARFGNLRDNDPLVFDPSGLNLPMYNWAPSFKMEIN